MIPDASLQEMYGEWCQESELSSRRMPDFEEAMRRAMAQGVAPLKPEIEITEE